jgi:hypothetical protein
MMETVYGCNLITVSADKYRLDFFEMWETYDYLAEKGYQGGGATWECLAEALISSQAPELESQVMLDGESDCLAIWSSSKEALVKLALLIQQTSLDRAKLDAAIALAEARGNME